MRLGLRGRLILATSGFIFLVGTAGAIFLEVRLRSWFERHTEATIKANAESARVLVEATPEAGTPEALLPLVRRIDAATGARITVIDANGVVIGDSRVPAEQLVTLDNHGQRPEVIDARRGGLGVSQRHSTTVGTQMLYVAVPYEGRAGAGVVRAAVPLREKEQVVVDLRLLLVVGGALAFFAAVALIAAASHFLSRELRGLVTHARRIADGETVKRLGLSEKGELGGLAGSFNRLAKDLNRSVRALARERDRLETVLEGMSGAVVALDEEGRISLLNQAALKLLRLPEPPLGRSFEEIGVLAALGELVEDARGSGSASDEFDLPGLPRQRVLARVTSQRASRGVIAVLHDVTDLRRLETIRRDFVANVSHELRTPVSVILANTETLLDAGLFDMGGPEQGFLEAIDRNANRLSRIIADLLDISRIEARAYPIEREPMLLAEAAKRAAEGVSAAASKRRIALPIEVDRDVRLFADPKAVDQVLLNLLDNAVKYTAEGGSVTLRSRVEGRNVRIEVADTGPGIEKRHRDRIFERFYRVDPGRSRDRGGTGLGLAIVKHLVGAMRGQVGVEANEPSGSVFWVELRRPHEDVSDS